MIITVTMNPAIDKTVEVETFIHKGLNRISKVEYDAGGKGINVSKTICELGGQSVATGFLAGNSGRMISDILESMGIQGDFVSVFGETRTNTKIVEEDASLTELNEPGPIITEADIDLLKEKLLSYANDKAIFIFAGSIPTNISKTIYGELISLVRSEGARVLLDADGDAFLHAIEQGPDMIKPNHVEMAEYVGISPNASVAELISAAEEMQKKGIINIVLSMGKDGALFLLEDYKVQCPGLEINAHSPVGAGDAMVAAFAYALDSGLSKEDTVKLCMAASAGAVTTIGTKPPSRTVVDTLLKQVIIKEM